jgi:cyanophycinase-like exopeptidase
MKLYLFGGAEVPLGEVDPLIQLINQVIISIKPKQILHIPYARTNIPKGEEGIWGEGWVKSKLYLQNIELLDARKSEDLNKADRPLIFINGGRDHRLLMQGIVSNRKLFDLVMNADYLIGESAGAMVVGEYKRDYVKNGTALARGLGILKDTIIEPLYTQRNRHDLLREEMQEINVDYGIGIDTVTGIVIDTNSYPQGYEVLGSGLVDFVQSKK